MVNMFLKKYKLHIWTMALVILHGLRSWGYGLAEAPILSGIAVMCAVLAVIATRYSKREILCIALISALTLSAFVINHDKTLVMTLIVAIGVKEIDYIKALKICLWSRVALIATRVLLVLLGLMDNSYLELPKYSPETGSTLYRIPVFGYGHPNFLFMGIVSVGILYIALYGEKRKLLHYIIITIAFYGAYKVLMCRTGFYLWLVVLALVLIYELLRVLKIENAYCRALSFSPFVLLILSIVMAILRLNDNQGLITKIDYTFSGRFFWVADWIERFYLFPLPRAPFIKYDNGYFFCLYNYGFVLTVILIVLSCVAMWHACSVGKDYVVLALTACFGYMMGEMMPLSVAWNVSIIFISAYLFDLSLNINAQQVK